MAEINTDSRCGTGEFPCPYCVEATCRQQPPMVIQHLMTLNLAIEFGQFPKVDPFQPACGSHPDFFVDDENENGDG